MVTWTEVRGRAVVHERSQGRCEMCGQRNATEWSHRLPRSAGGTWHPGNGLDACRQCHALVHAQPGDAYLCGWAVPRGADPLTVAMRLAHPVYGPAWWMATEDGGLRWLAPWQPPRALEQLPTHKTGRVVRR